MSVRDQIALRHRHSRGKCYFCKRVCTFNFACHSKGQIIYMDEKGIYFKSWSCPQIAMLSTLGLQANRF